mgnify:CR=1 FL=1
MKFNNETIRTAVKEWLENSNEAEAKYGHISDWDVCNVTEMLNKIEEPMDYINAVSKLLPYCLPKVKPIDTKIQDIEPVVINLHMDKDDE